MYCPQCGNANDDSAAFCGKCGMDLKKYKERWSVPAGDADASATNEGAADAADSAGAVAGEPQVRPEPAQPAVYSQHTAYPPPSAYPAPSAYPPPYRQQYPQSYQTPPYQQAAPGRPQGAYYQPAPYQPAPYQPGYGVMPGIPSHMAFAIVTLILCFLPTGIVAVVYASNVGNRLALGDVLGAQEASGKANMWCWITFGIGVALWALVILGVVLAAVEAGTGSNTF